MPPPRENAYNFGCLWLESDKTKNLKATYRRVQYWEFRKNIANESPLRYKFLAAGPLPRAKFHVYRGNVSPLKTHFWTIE